MNWRLKAAVQNIFGRLPIGSEAAYYLLQRHFGNLRNPEPPIEMLRHGAQIFAELRELGTPVAGARVLEVGTGHRINMPLAFYLCGAASIISVDLNRILKRDLVMETIRDLTSKREEVVAALALAAGAAEVLPRLEALASAQTFGQVCDIVNLAYRAPCNAAATELPGGSIDIHFSYTVFEHIPGPELIEILREASRLIAPTGCICHHIDLSDHFSHSDKSITNINFLRFSDSEWRTYNNESFGYQNRLRVTDYQQIYEEARQLVLRWVTIVDPAAVAQLRDGFDRAPQYRNQSPEVLATVSVRALSRPAPE